MVQLRRQADPGEGVFVGRVEHIASGASARFDSVAELIAFITASLTPTPSSDGEPAP